MTKVGLLRRAGTIIAAGLLAILLLVGCGGVNGGNKAPDTEKQTKSPPTETFKYGTHEAKVYALTGVDLQDKIRTWRLAALGNDIFFQVGNKPAHMAKVTLQGEVMSDYVDLGETGDSNDIAVNDKIALWEGHNYKLATYDGKEIQRYEGVPGGRREFCVTDKYVVYADAEHNVRVYDKKNGKLLGDAKVSFQPFALWTLKGNEVLVYDEVSKLLYRIDF